MLAGPKPFPYALLQPRYWVALDPNWDWRTLTIETYPAFFAKSLAAVSPVMDANDADLGRFFARGGKIILFHGFNDGGILPRQSIDYYERVARRQHMSLRQLQAHAQLYLFPGVGHCGGGAAPQPPVDRLSDALVAWVEHGIPPQGLVALQEDAVPMRRSRPICPYPTLAYYKGSGNPDLAASFSCHS
jgi:feruloyl esterase